MIESGIGACRYGRLGLSGEPLYMLCATSTGVCAGGVPVVVHRDDFERTISDIRADGSAIATIRGRAQLFGSSAFATWGTVRPDEKRKLPKWQLAGFREHLSKSYYLMADRLDVERGERQPISVAATVTFQQKESNAWLTSYCSFSPNPRSGERKLEDALEWLQRYVSIYGVDGSIIADFDAYHSHFGKPRLAMASVVGAEISPENLKAVAVDTHCTILVMGDYIRGDQFKDIKKSKIGNRSAFVFDPSPRPSK